VGNFTQAGNSPPAPSLEHEEKVPLKFHISSEENKISKTDSPENNAPNENQSLHKN